MSASFFQVDKSLVKNLVVGYACADGSKKPEVLKIVATVLDFNREERQKTGLEGNQSWLRGWLGGPAPQGDHGTRRARTTSTEVQQATGLDQSLAKAFVQFLETESTPKVSHQGMKLLRERISKHFLLSRFL